MRHSAAPTWAMGNSVSTTSGSSSSTPSPSLRARPHGVDPQQDIAGIGQQRLAWGVMTGRLPGGRTATPSSDSMLAMAWLTADCTASWRQRGHRRRPRRRTRVVRVRASSIGVSDLWNRSVALKLSLNRIATDGHAGGFDTRTQKAAMDQHETDGPARGDGAGHGADRRRAGRDAGGHALGGGAGHRGRGRGGGAASGQGHHRRAAVAADMGWTWPPSVR